jgi:radical SAM-linked protein
MIKYTVSLFFNKTGFMRYLSHLDLMRLFSRALRRSGFKLYLTKGFNPRPVVRIKNALKLGIEASGQEIEFVLEEAVSKEDFCQRINRQLPEGILIS